jgi:hypothetical protein
MLPGHEIDRNLPLRKLFTTLTNRAVELSRSDLPMRRALDEFSNETGYDFKEGSFSNVANHIILQSEISKDMAYGVLGLQHFVEYVEYLAFNAEEAKKRGMTEQFQGKLEDAYKTLEKLSRYADGILLETGDLQHHYTSPVGHDAH